MKSISSLLITLATIAISTASHGAITAISQGDQFNYAIWDNFGSSSSFTNLAANSSAGGYSTALLSSTTIGAIVSGGGDRIYGFSPPNRAVPHDLTLTANYVPSEHNMVLLQIALSDPSPDDFLLGEDGETRSKNYFDVSMNGAAADSIFLMDTQIFNDTNYRTWGYLFDTSGLASGTVLNFVLDGFDYTTGHVSLDAIALSSVPEPSRLLLGMAGLGCLLLRRHRRKPKTSTSLNMPTPVASCRTNTRF